MIGSRDAGTRGTGRHGDTGTRGHGDGETRGTGRHGPVGLLFRVCEMSDSSLRALRPLCASALDQIYRRHTELPPRTLSQRNMLRSS